MNRYPASVIQKQFWLLHKIQPENSAYNIPSLFRIKGSLDVTAFHQGLRTVIEKHGILRSTFHSEEGGLFQVVHENIEDFFSSRVEDCLQQASEVFVRKRIEEDICQPFNLEEGPLVRVVLYKLTENESFLLIVMHHIVTDLRSKEVFAAELSYYYNAIVSERVETVVAEADQYGEYSLWQHEYLQSDQYKKNLAFWVDRFAGKKPYLNLPIDKSRPVVQGMKGSAVFWKIPIEINEKLRAYCKGNGVPTFLFTLTAFTILLHRYTGQAEITLGVPFTNRRNESYKNTIGCFVNILPITCFFSSSEDTFIDVLRQLRKTMLGAHRNQEIPYENLVKELQLRRDPSYNPFFQTGFTFEPPMEIALTGVSVEAEKIHNHGAQLDLFANLWESEGGLHGLFEYNTSLFERATVERFVVHFQTILQDILTNSQRSIDCLKILSDNEKALFERWNRTERPLEGQPLLHCLFEEQVIKNPAAIACSSVSEGLSYQSLDEKASRLAHFLWGKGVKPGVLVGIFMDRSVDMVIALLAVLKAGGAYVPLDPEFPKDRIAYMLENSQAAVLLTTSDLLNQIPPSGAKEVFVDIEMTKINQYPVDNFDTGVGGDDLAYVIYTSGSTGLPKGVMVHHRAVVNFIQSMKEDPGLTADDLLLAVTTLSFDIAVLELFLPLAVGAQVVIAPKEYVADGECLKEIITSKNISVMQATPTTWRLLIGAGWVGGTFKALCGGEPMPADLAADLLQRATSVWNLYGPTETTIWSTCHHVSEADNTVIVGRPIANTTTYIVDKHDQPTPVGVAGELLVGGLGVTKGYHGRPNLTAKSFVPDKFSKVPGQKIYRTGDMATYLPDGNIRIHGRIDQQVKLRGYRIELGEIEAVLLSHDEIEQSAVVVRDVGVGDQRLVAYYTSKGGVLDIEEIKKLLREKLPQYMIPSFFKLLEKMPLTANGKIDRGRLPTPVLSDSVSVDSYVQAGTKLEEDICSIWREVLQVGRVGVEDNFFDIGGNSLLVVQILRKVERILEYQVPTVKFFQYPTIAAFARYLREQNVSSLDKSIEKNAALQKQALLRQKQRLKRKR